MDRISKFLFMVSFAAQAFAEVMIIADDETEAYLLDIVENIKEALHYDRDIKIYISNDSSINASAIDSGDIVINSGAITQIDNYKELIAILAHEVGHIEGSHITLMNSSTSDFIKAGLVTALIGVVVAACAGYGVPVVAGLAGGSSVARGMALGKMRQKENIADTKSAEAIKRLNWPVFEGFVSLHEKLSSGMMVYNKYLLTHPLPIERLSKFKQYKNPSNIPEKIKNLMNEYETKFKTIKYKIQALTIPQEHLNKFHANPKSSNEKYARAIALYRSTKYEDSIKLIDQLISENVSNKAYYAEIKCMALINLKRCKESADIAYEILKNSRKLKDHRDLGIIYGASAIQGNLTEHYAKSIEILRKILVFYEKDLDILNTLGKLYDISGDGQRASLCASEVSMQLGDLKMAHIHAKRAIRGKDKITSRKAQDILNYISNTGARYD